MPPGNRTNWHGVKVMGLAPMLAAYRSHLFEVSVHAGGERGHFVGKLRQCCGVAFGQLSNAPGKRLRDVVEFPLHGILGRPHLLLCDLWILNNPKPTEIGMALLNKGEANT